MVNFTTTDPVADLERRLLEGFPHLAPEVALARERYGDPSSAYWYLSYVVRPYLARLVESQDADRIEEACAFLEDLSVNGSPSERNQVFVTMEELDLWKLYRWLGPTMRTQWFEQIAWYPEWKDRTTHDNPHVDKERYRERWRQEIDSVGGFEHLTTERELLIRYQLKREFGINGLRAPKPGGLEWRRSGLSWPVGKGSA